MVIFEGKYLNLLWTVGEVPGTYYSMSEKGWTDQELFKHWLKDHFLQYPVPSQPLLILLDGLSSHYEPASIELARTEGVITFCLPPHTTQDSQPLDCTVFGPLKRHWSAICHKFQQKHPGMLINCKAISFPDDGDSGSSGTIPRNPMVITLLLQAQGIRLHPHLHLCKLSYFRQDLRKGIISTMTKTTFHGLNLIIQKQHHPI